MEVPVLVERLSADGYRASSPGLDAASEAPTREAALDGLSRILRDKFATAELVCLEIPLDAENHPWKPMIGRLRSHPDIDEIEQQMSEYRRQMDALGDRP